MRRHQFPSGIVLFWLVVLILAVPLGILASPPSTSTHSISWVSGTSSVISQATRPNDTMVSSPVVNLPTEHILRLQFSSTGDLQPGEAEIRLPAHIFTDRAGQPVGTYEVPMVEAPGTSLANFYNYRYDAVTDELVISNFALVPSGRFLTVDIKYTVRPHLVKDGYIKDFTADFSLGDPAGTPLVFSSNTAKITYHTKADLNVLTKRPHTSQTYYNWPSALGTPPPGANEWDYYYVTWAVYGDALADDTQPFTFSLTETNPAGNPSTYGELIGYSIPGGGPTAGDLAQFHAENPHFDIAVPGSLTNGTYYLYFRYPKPTGAPAVHELTVENNVHGEVLGIDGVSSTLSAQATAKVSVDTARTPTPVPTATTAPTTGPSPTPWVLPSPTIHSSSKTNNGVSYGHITKLEENRPPFDLATTVTNGPFSFGGHAQGYHLTRDAGGNYGATTYTNEIIDNHIRLSNGTTSTVTYTDLNPEDYAFTTFRFGGYTEFELVNSDMTNNDGKTQEREANEYSAVTLQVDTGAGWQDYGSILRTAISPAAYSFTPLMAGASATGTTSLLVTLPQNTHGVRLLHTTRSYSTQFLTSRLGMILRNTPHVLSLIKDRDAVLVHNQVRFALLKDGLEVSNQVRSAYHQINRVVPRTYIQKTRTEPVNDPYTGTYYVDYIVREYENAAVPETVLEEATALGYLLEQRVATFHDLLPPGTYVDPGTIKVTGYLTNIPFTTTYELENNYRGTGRDMLRVHATAPADAINYHLLGHVGGYGTITSGMQLTFRLHNPWLNIADNGPVLVNYVAFESRNGSLVQGYPDNAASAAIPAELKAAFTDISDVDPSWTNTLYANVSLRYEPLTAVSVGFSKAVSSPENPEFGDHAQTPLAGSYTYRLRFQNAPDMRAKDIVLYDALEVAYGSNPYWQGTFQSIDVSQTTAKGIDAKVYYATSPVDVAADTSHLDNNMGTVWLPLTTATDPQDVKSLAVDLRRDTAGDEYIVSSGETLLVNIVMRAPADARDEVRNRILAYNASSMSNRKAATGSAAFDLDLALERANTVTVELREMGLEIDKQSDPASGTKDAPTNVAAGDDLQYMVSLTNTNQVQAIERILLQDMIPSYLSYAAGDIIVRLGDNPASDTPLAQSTRASLVSDADNLLVIHVNTLAGQEKITFLIPTKVLSIDGVTQEASIINQAMVSSVAGQDYLLASPSTHHRLKAVPFIARGTKALSGRAISPDDQFQFELVSQLGQVFNSLPVNPLTGAFAFPPIYYDKPGTYNYTIREKQGTNPLIHYSGAEIQLVVTVTQDAEGNLMATGAYSDGVSPLNTAVFTNRFAPLNVALAARKTLTGETLSAGQFTFRLTGQGVNQSMTNAADGSVIFDAITLQSPGPHTFTITETAGTRQGMVYDTAEYTVQVSVVRDSDGTPAAVITYLKDGSAYAGDVPVFANQYTDPEPPPPTYPTLEVPLSASKTLSGGMLRGGEFRFLLKDAQGNVLADATNAADGTITFPVRTFSRVVTNYLYTIEEVRGDNPLITYDGTVYTVLVTTRAVNGRLEATVDVLKDGTPYAGAIAFANRRHVPPTGDTALRLPLVLLMAGALLGGGALIWEYRKRRAR